MVSEFVKYPIASFDNVYQDCCRSLLRVNVMHALGAGTIHTMNSLITGIFFAQSVMQS